VLLRTIDYGESDRVVTLLGRSTGCVGAIARGARKSQRRFGGGLDLCVVGEAGLRERPGSELLTLERFDVTQSFSSLGADVACMGHAAYVAELVAKLCAPRQPEPGIFDWLTAFLAALDGDGPSAERLRIFELGLLERLGFAPALEACAACGREDLARAGATIDVRWDPGRGGVICKDCGARGRPMRPVVRQELARLAAEARRGMTAAQTPSGSAASAAGAASAPATSAADVARGCRDALRELIGTHLSAPLKSLEFLAKLPREAGGEA